MVKRPPEERRRLPPELEAFARSDEEKLRIRRPRVDRGTIRDPREGYTVAGVANRDARAVYDVRSAAMRELWDEGAADERALASLGQLFHDALRLELWHARRLTSFAAFAEEVVGVPVARAEQLADEAAERTGEPVTPLTEVSIALWLRTEAGLYEGDETARARVRSGERGLVLEISVDLAEASTALAGVGARHLPLARSLPQRDDARDDRREPPYREREREPEPPVYREPELEAEPVEDLAAESFEDEPGAPEEVNDAGETSKPVIGGARLLTRKAPSAREQLGESVDRDAGEQPWGRREARAERASFGSGDRGAAPRDRGERPRSQQDGPRGGNDRGGFQQNRGNDRGERPRFGGNDRGGFQQNRGNDRGERPRFGGNDRDERPRSGGNDRGGFTQIRGQDRGGFTQNRSQDRGGFTQNRGNDRGERPRFHDGPRGGNDRGGFTQNRGNDRGERPRFGGGGDRPRAGQDSRGGFTQGGSKPAKGFGARKQFDAPPERAPRDRDDGEE